MHNILFAEDALEELETGEDLEIVLEQENLLEHDEDKKTFKEVLQSIGRKDLATKMEVYLAVGQYFW